MKIAGQGNSKKNNKCEKKNDGFCETVLCYRSYHSVEIIIIIMEKLSD